MYSGRANRAEQREPPSAVVRGGAAGAGALRGGRRHAPALRGPRPARARRRLAGRRRRAARRPAWAQVRTSYVRGGAAGAGALNFSRFYPKTLIIIELWNIHQAIDKDFYFDDLRVTLLTR